MESSFLKLTVDGKVVAEAPLYIYDHALAWQAFMDAFSSMQPLVVGEWFNTMRIACHQNMLDVLGPQTAFEINLSTTPVKEVVGSFNGHN